MFSLCVSSTFPPLNQKTFTFSSFKLKISHFLMLCTFCAHSNLTRPQTWCIVRLIALPASLRTLSLSFTVVEGFPADNVVAPTRIWQVFQLSKWKFTQFCLKLISIIILTGKCRAHVLCCITMKCAYLFNWNAQSTNSIFTRLCGEFKFTLLSFFILTRKSSVFFSTRRHIPLRVDWRGTATGM